MATTPLPAADGVTELPDEIPTVPGAVVHVRDAAAQADTLSAPESELPPGRMVGEYRIERKIGQGGMGEVYGAIHPLIGKRAAIKVLSRRLCTQPEAVARFVTEARAVNQIGHPNIIDVFSFGKLPDGRSYLVMEWLEGRSLAERLRAGRPPLGEVCAVLDGVAEALEAAHGKRIVHRDLKPDNTFLVTAPGGGTKVTLLDFGIAKLLDDSSEGLTRTRTGSLMGTPLYMAPEQARGHEIDARVDIYSLGAMGFEMATGRPPFVADNAMDVVSMHLHADPPLASSVVAGVPTALDQLLYTALAKQPDGRPSLAHVRAVLATVRRELDVGPAPRTARASRPRWIALAVGVVVVGGGLGGFAMRGGRDEPATPAKPSPVEVGAAVVEPAPTPTPTPAPARSPLPAPSPPAPSVPETEAPGIVVIRVGERGAAVELDGRAIALTSGAATVSLAPGTHRMRVTAAGHHARLVEFQLAPGESLELAPQLDKKKRRDVAPRPSATPVDRAIDGQRSGAGTTTPPVDDDDVVVNPFRRTK